VKVGDFSRGGKLRSATAVKAVDHDMAPDAVLVPLGILELNRGATAIHQPLFCFGHSKETSDFIADGLDLWWAERKTLYPGVRCLHVELDNGPEVASSRTQFLKRLVDFVDRHRVELRLVYLPPYHSKYNPIERCWGALEQHWNGALLDSIPTALRFAQSMTWKGKHPLVELISKSYSKGVKLTRQEMAELEKQIERLPGLAKWFVTFPASSSSLG
jgi:transposase